MQAVITAFKEIESQFGRQLQVSYKEGSATKNVWINIDKPLVTQIAVGKTMTLEPKQNGKGYFITGVLDTTQPAPSNAPQTNNHANEIKELAVKAEENVRLWFYIHKQVASQVGLEVTFNGNAIVHPHLTAITQSIFIQTAK